MSRRISAIGLAIVIIVGMIFSDSKAVLATENNETYTAHYENANFQYQIIDGTAKITRAYISTDHMEIKFPSEVDGIPVTTIGSNVNDWQRKSPYTWINVEIPEGITTIEERAFVDGDIYSIRIPSSITSIGEMAFKGNAIGNVIVASMDSWSKINFGGDGANPLYTGATLRCNGQIVTEYTFTKEVKSISDYVFQGCKSIESVTIPNHIESIGDSAFEDCENLMQVNMGEGVENIGNNCFKSCDSLASIEIPNSVTSIGDSAFSYCTSLTSVQIPDSVVDIGVALFEGCYWLQTVEISKNLKHIKDRMFYGCTQLTDVAMAEDIQSIGDEAFGNSGSLKNMRIPSSVTSIGQSAFANSRISTVEWPDNITRIKEKTFAGCQSLESIIMSSVIAIEELAFFGSGLKSITLPKTVQYIGPHAIPSEGCIIYGWINSYAQKYATDNQLQFEAITFPVIYDANGGYNEPEQQQKKAGEDLKLTNDLPEKTDHAFLGWSTNPNGNVEYTSGSLYESDCAITLYAIWQPGYAVTYEANGGYGAPETQVKQLGKALVLDTTIPQKDGAFFAGWSTNPNGNVAYAAGTLYTEEAQINLYAQWVEIKECSCVGGRIQADCPYCSNGKIYVSTKTCGQCGGDGKEEVTKQVTDPCVFCDATGWESYLITPCHFCGGEGEFTYDETETKSCSVCLGSGGITQYETCTHCSRGRIWVDCPSCDDGILNPEYLLSYDANGGKNTPSGKRNYVGVSMCINFQIPERFGHIFKGWSLQPDGEVVYQPGSTYLGKQSATLYAVWQHDICPEGVHVFSVNQGLTCKYCGYSKKPEKPQLESKATTTIVLVTDEIYEYSMDGETWQNSGVFNGLVGNTTYTFYKRVKDSSVAVASEKSEGLKVYLKKNQEKPSAPTILSYTDATITLIPMINGEYSLDGVNWQTKNVFENLLPATQYTVYQRYAETETHEASESSTGTSVTTDQSKQTLIPDAPTIQSVTSSSITLTPADGCEYSKDGITWQSSNVFTGLSCGTEYTFYQRYKETSSTLVGKSSEGTTCKTDKGTQTAPSKPSLSSKTHNSVTLTKVNGYEYSMDGINWQKSNVFTGLNPETNYLFYQRKAETGTHCASEASSSLIVKTREMYESIIVSTVPNKTSYIEGKDDLDISGGKISLCYPDGATEIIDMTADMVTGFDNTIVGNQNLTVNYGGYTTTFTVQIIAKSVVSIAVTTKPNKLTYLEGESFDKTGMIITAYYNNGTSENVTDFTISGYTSSPGNKTIVVTYNGKNAEFVVVVNAKPVTGTWKYDGIGWWYQNSNGTYPRSCWKEIDNVWYYFNASGYILTGWQSIDGIWYYFNGSGAMMTGWQSIGGTWYYFNGSGAMLTSWQSIGGTWYYFNGSGAMQTGWQSIGGTWYYFNGSGAMATGWQSIGGTWYYFNGSGAMLTGWQSIGGAWYYFEGSGAMVTNRWVGNYYLQADGTMATNKWIGSYYVGADGVWIP